VLNLLSPKIKLKAFFIPKRSLYNNNLKQKIKAKVRKNRNLKKNLSKNQKVSQEANLPHKNKLEKSLS